MYQMMLSPKKVIDYAIKEGLTNDPGVSGGIAALKDYDHQYEKIFGPKRVKTPEVFCISTANSNDALHRYMMDNLQELEENLKVKKYLFDVPKFVISGDYIPFEWLKGNPNLGLVQPYCKIELNNEKEKEKMDAKKCDRCGKLYDKVPGPIKAYLCGRVTEDEKQTYTHEKIKERNTYTMEVKLSVYGSNIDMCPDCCKKLAEFFDSGADEAKE